jgi:hypothetical protein
MSTNPKKWTKLARGGSANFDETIATISGPRSSPLPPIYYTGLAVLWTKASSSIANQL